MNALEQLFAHSRDAVVIAQATGGRIVRWNPAAEALFGYSATDAARIHYWNLVEGSRGGRMQISLAAYPGTRARARSLASTRVTAIGADGVAFPADVVVAPASPPDVEPGLVLLLFRKALDEQVRATEEFRRVRFEGALVEARTVNHHLRNHLGQVVGYASLLTEDPTMPTEQRFLAEQVLAGAENAVALLEQLTSITDLVEVDEGLPAPILRLEVPARPGPI